MGLGDTTMVQGVPVKDIAADYMEKQTDGSFSRFNFKTVSSQVKHKGTDLSKLVHDEVYTCRRKDDIVRSNEYIVEMLEYTDTSFGQMTEDGEIEILVSGWYHITLTVVISDAAANSGSFQASILKSPFVMVAEQTSPYNTRDNKARMNASGVFHFAEGEKIRFYVVNPTKDSAYRISGAHTTATVVPLFYT